MGEAKRRKLLDPNFGKQGIKKNQNSIQFLTKSGVQQILTSKMTDPYREINKIYQNQKNHAIWICQQPSDKYAFVVSKKLDLDFSAAIYLVEFLKEILTMSLDDTRNISDPARSVYLSQKNSQRAKQLGRLIDKVRGFEGMQFVAYKVPQYDQAEINECWHGIGQWQC